MFVIWEFHKKSKPAALAAAEIEQGNFIAKIVLPYWWEIINVLKPGVRHLVVVDRASTYKTIQDNNPELIPTLARVSHKKGWTEKARIDDTLVNLHTNGVDGSFAHLRRHISNHMVHAADAHRYGKEFQFRYGSNVCVFKIF